MILHDVKVHPESDRLKREDQLAWKIAAVAADPVALDADVEDMIINRVIDNASVAIASANRHPVVSARAMALAHPRDGGATVFGADPSVSLIITTPSWPPNTRIPAIIFRRSSRLRSRPARPARI